mmetsp:Transcript_64175/g.130411  ORF Transcript_64175/g.130411 Transcript_64175/m.130411 type:complete len:86 (+) Transcript_64175:1308-1565(+)
MARTANKNRMVADLDTPDTRELRKLIEEVGHKLKEVEEDPDFSKHQVVHHARGELPKLEHEVDLWATKGSLLQRFQVLVHEAGLS